MNITYNEAEASERALFSCEKESYAVIVYSNNYGRVNSYDEQYILKKIFVIRNVFRHVISVKIRRKENREMRDVNTSKRNKKKSLILQGIKPHRAKRAIAYGG